MQIIGHHGTSFDSSKKIEKSNFSPSIGDDEWLGDGVYFFTQGISSKTVELAEKWAVVSAWDKMNKKNKYDRYSVLECLIEVDEDCFLDTTTEDGLEVFEYLITKFEEALKKRERSLRTKNCEGKVINMARKEGILPIDVAKGNFYIKFANERINIINRRISNCTICAVYDPTKNVKSIQIIKESDVL